MKSESNIRPPAFNIEKCGDIDEIVLFDNIKEKEHEGETVFTYDEYRINVPHRENLFNDISENIAAWLQFAKKKEIALLSDAVRAERNRLLELSDKTQFVDVPLTPEKKCEWAVYRQALRDIPEQDGFPYEVQWPVKPDLKRNKRMGMEVNNETDNRLSD